MLKKREIANIGHLFKHCDANFFSLSVLLFFDKVDILCNLVAKLFVFDNNFPTFCINFY